MRFAFRRDLALGRYVALDTPVHRLDPRTKLVVFVGLLAALFAAGLTGTSMLLLLLLSATRLARIPGRRVLRGLRAMTWIFAITFLFQALWVGPARLSGVAEGAEIGVWMTLRLVAMLVGAILLTFTTEPIRLADGLGRLFGFLEKLKIPVRSLSMVLTLALRFLPTVMEEAQRIVTAQRARGASFEGGILRRARMLLPLAVPLFTGCLHRADTLALAMEARGYRSESPRTQLEPLAFAPRDGWALGGLAVILVLTFALARGA